MKARGRITLTKDPRNSKRIIDREETTQILDATHVMRKATSQEIVPKTKDPLKENKKKRHHAHIAEDDEPTKKKTREDSSSDE